MYQMRCRASATVDMNILGKLRFNSWFTQSLYGFRSQLTYISQPFIWYSRRPLLWLIICINASSTAPVFHNDEVFRTFCFWLLWSCFFFFLAHLFVVPLMILSRLHRFEERKNNEMYLKKKIYRFFLSVSFCTVFSIKTLWKKRRRRSRKKQ